MMRNVLAIATAMMLDITRVMNIIGINPHMDAMAA